MIEPEREPDSRIGEILQAYVHARWASRPDAQAVARIAAQVDAKLRERVDALGFDAERLLTVGPNAALQELERLEHEAARKDARAAQAAAKAGRQRRRGRRGG
jgi:hypothetical protein